MRKSLVPSSISNTAASQGAAAKNAPPRARKTALVSVIAVASIARPAPRTSARSLLVAWGMPRRPISSAGSSTDMITPYTP